MAEKEDLRRILRARRKGMGASMRRDGSRRVASRGRRILCQARHIAAYWPHGSELDPRPLMRALARFGCTLYLPVVNKKPHYPLSFARWHPPLRSTARGSVEPRWGRRRQVSALDVVLVPLLGFDACGSRLGQGGGHYDRTFARLVRTRGLKPALIGVAFECQRVKRVPKEPHDVSLHAVLTEKRLYRVRRLPL